MNFGCRRPHALDTETQGAMGPKTFRKAFANVLQRVVKNIRVSSRHRPKYPPNELAGAPVFAGLRIFLLYVVSKQF